MKSAKHPAQRKGPGPLRSAPPAGARKRVLLVDDHPMMRAGLAALIRQQPDLEVCAEAGSVAEALAEIPKRNPDLVVTDITLPGRGGLELIKDIKALYPDLPALVISMHDEMLHAERSLRAGARGYLMKEAGAEKMLEAIRRVLSGHVYVSERMSTRIFDNLSGQRERRSPIERLTDREFEVFQLIGEGKTTRAIAQQLNLSSKTVDVHRGHIKEKLALPDSTSLVGHAVRWVESQNSGNSG
ncbi:MAG: response regulator transcription factor [Verrucomicrobia bacterium]|nr:response regulator transcription factor [Verrucomicrobiota bacterium]MBI3868444.1 response regulator transcription factor [Verrucomicrobiota bacterium]